MLEQQVRASGLKVHIGQSDTRASFLRNNWWGTRPEKELSDQAPLLGTKKLQVYVIQEAKVKHHEFPRLLPKEQIDLKHRSRV